MNSVPLGGTKNKQMNKPKNKSSRDPFKNSSRDFSRGSWRGSSVFVSICDFVVLLCTWLCTLLVWGQSKGSAGKDKYGHRKVHGIVSPRPKLYRFDWRRFSARLMRRPVGLLLAWVMMANAVHGVRAQSEKFNDAPSTDAKSQCMAKYNTFKEENAECAFLWSKDPSKSEPLPSIADCSAQFEHFTRNEGGKYMNTHKIEASFHRAFPQCDRSTHSCMARKETARAVYGAVYTAHMEWFSDDVFDEVFEDAFPDCHKSCDSARWFASHFTEQPIVVSSITKTFSRCFRDSSSAKISVNTLCHAKREMFIKEYDKEPENRPAFGDGTEPRRWLAAEERVEAAFQQTFPECRPSNCEARRNAAQAFYERLTNRMTRHVGNDSATLTHFDTIFDTAIPDCDVSKAVVVRRRRRLGRRYELCDIGTSGEYTQSSDCSITEKITVNGRLKITGTGTEKPAIDGGWDEVQGSGTGVQLFYVWSADNELIIENMILTHGEHQYSGGGFIIGNGATIKLSNCVVSHNSAAEGGGFYISSSGATTIELSNCIVSHNSAAQTQWGFGSAFSFNGGPITMKLSNCVVSHNSAGSMGKATLYISVFNSNDMTIEWVNVKFESNNFIDVTFSGGYTGSLIAINTEFANTEPYTNFPSTAKQCDFSITFCDDFGLPGHDCSNRGIKGVSCEASVNNPYIKNLTSNSCVTESNYQLEHCPTTGTTITLTGFYFNQPGSTAKSVKVGSSLCPYTSWTSTEIVCNLAPGISTEHKVNVTAANGNSNIQLDYRQQMVSFGPPNVTRVSPQPGTTKSEVTTFRGENFGTTPSPITISIDGQPCTNITWISNTEVRAMSPVWGGGGLLLTMSVGGQLSSSPIFSYKAPIIDQVSPTFGGGTMTIYGDEFANITIEKYNIVIHDKTQSVPCPQVKRLSYTGVSCEFNDQGKVAGCLDKNVTVEVNGLVSNPFPICYASVVVPSPKQLLEGTSYTYPVSLSHKPFSTVVVKLTNANLQCTCHPTEVSLNASNYKSGVPVTITLPGNEIDEGSAISDECQIVHTITSAGAMYAQTPPSSFTISVLNDDEADVKLQIPQDDGSFEYRLKVMGPMTIDEGTSTKYALVLDTQPSANVSVSATIFAPRPNTPLTARLAPPSLMFTTSNWNVPQVVTFNASNDDIDNDKDTETFRIVYHATTEDSIFQSKATNNTVIVEVADDDTAGIQVDDGVLQLVEGGEPMYVRVLGLATKPLGNMTLFFVPSTSNLKVYPSTISVTQDEWNRLNRTIQVQALKGDYSGGTSLALTVEAQSTDPKYDGMTRTTPVVVAAETCNRPGVLLNTSTGACNPCPEGYACENGASDPVPCGAGTFAPSGQSECTECPVGRYNPDRARAACPQCPPGTFQDAPKQTACIECDIHTFSDQYGNTAKAQCTKCATDFVPHTETETTGSTSSAACICEPIGFYPAFAASKQLAQCHACPRGATCAHPATNRSVPRAWMQAQPGYWETPTAWNVPLGLTYVPCESPALCTPTGCIAGTAGVLCETCSPGYGKRAGACETCDTSSVVTYTAILVVCVLLMTLVVYLVERKLYAHRHYAAAWKEFMRVVKINVDFLQVNSAMPSVMSVSFPTNFIDFTSTFDFINVDMLSLTGAACASGVNFMTTFGVMSLLPWCALLIGALVYVCGQRRKIAADDQTLRRTAHDIFLMVDEDRSGTIDPEEYRMALKSIDTTGIKQSMDEREFTDRVLSLDGARVTSWWKGKRVASTALYATVQILLLVHTPVTRKVFEFFNCRTVHTREFLKADYTIECWSPAYTWFSFYVIFVGLAFTLGFPIYAGAYLLRNRQSLYTGELQARIGFLYAAFIKGSEGWEVHEIGRKTLLTGFLLFLQSRPLVQAAVGSMICGVSMCSLNYFQPHKNRVVFWLAQTSFLVTFLKFLCATVLIGSAGHAGIGALMIASDVFFFVASLGGLIASLVLLHRKIKALDQSKRTKVLPRVTSGEPPGRPEAGADTDVKNWGVPAPSPAPSAPAVEDRPKMSVI